MSVAAEALRRRCCARVALAAGEPQRDLAMLEHFERSLPAAVRPRIFAPLGLLGTLLVAYVLANFVVQAASAKLLGDLTTATVDLDRSAAIEAFERSNLEAEFLFGATILIAWSVVIMILPLPPSFSVRRRLLDEQVGLMGLEARVFAALGARRVHDLELDLVAQALIVGAICVLAAGVPVGELGDPVDERDVTGAWIFGAILLALSVVAGAGLLRRYRLRRQGSGASAGRTRFRRLGARVTGAALFLVWALSLLVLAVAIFR